MNNILKQKLLFDNMDIDEAIDYVIDEILPDDGLDEYDADEFWTMMWNEGIKDDIRNVKKKKKCGWFPDGY